VFFDERERKLGGRARAYPYAEEDEVVLLLRRGDFPAIDAALRAYAGRVGEWCSLGGRPPGQAFLRLYYNVERALHALGIGMAELTDGRDPFGTMTRLAGLEDSVRFFEGIFEEAGRRIERTRVPYRRAAVAKVIRHVDGHLREDLSLTKVGEIVFLSPAYLSTVFKEETGTLLSEYIGEARIRRAKEMLCSSRCSIHEVGEAVGYPNAHSFLKFFKAATGMTPGAFRAMHG
jgi:two-component system, response regulator YesN